MSHPKSGRLGPRNNCPPGLSHAHMYNNRFSFEPSVHPYLVIISATITTTIQIGGKRQIKFA